MKRDLFVLLLLSLLILAETAAAATMLTTDGLGQTVDPVRVYDNLASDHRAESTQAWALTDNRAVTSYSFLGWKHMLDSQVNALTFTFDNEALSGLWMRSGKQTAEEDYWAYGRPKTVKVTITRMDNSTRVLRYQMDDRYDMTTRSTDWYDGYQRLAFDMTYTNVKAVDLQITWFAGSEPATMNYIHIADIAFYLDPTMASTGWVTAPPVVTPTPKPAPVAGQPVYGLAIDRLATRSGPSTNYDEIGMYEERGNYVPVVSAAWDTRNSIWWLQVDVNRGTSNHRRIYTGLKRISIDIDVVPKEEPVGSAVVISKETAYYGPGTDYCKRNVTPSSGQEGTVICFENGYAQFEYKPKGAKQYLRVWLPESAVRLN